MSALKSIIRGTSRPTNYQTLPTSDLREGEVEEARTGDHDQAVYLSFWLFGAGCLLGWNALMCTFPLFVSFYPPDSTTGQSLPSLLSTVYCFGQLVFLGLAQAQVGKSSPTRQIRWSLLLLIATFILTTFPLLPLFLPTISTNLLLPSLLVIVLFLNLSGSYFQSAALALASMWGPSEILAALSGQGGVAVIISLVQVILAVIGVIGADQPAGDEKPSMLAGVGLWGLGSIAAGLCWLAFRFLTSHPAYERIVGSGRINAVGVDSGKKGNWDRSMVVLRKNKLLYLAVALDFAVTLSVFPAITSLIVSTHSPTPRLLRADVFIPLHFFIFNVGDYIGRTYIPSIPVLQFRSHPKILALSVARVIFIPLFLGCNLSTTPESPYLNSDVIYLIILILFGITNGYIASISMIVSSTPALNPKLEDDEKDVAGTMGVFCLMAGLTLGSMASFGVNDAVRG